MDRFLYRGARTREISFPLGGIGTGCIGLAGNGRLVDWEIRNRPNKGSANGFSHFAVRAEREGKVVDARVLNGDLPRPYVGTFGAAGSGYQTFGFGPPRSTMAGMPHFRDVEFRGEFPVAELTFQELAIEERAFPGLVTMRAFSPLIPLNDKDSGIPAALFEIEIGNTSKETTDYTVAGTLANPLPPANANTVSGGEGRRLLTLTSDAHREDEPGYGDLTLGTDSPDVSSQEYWYRGRWFDTLEVYWRDFTTPGRLKARSYPREDEERGKGARDDHGTLAAHVTLAPGESARVRFVISWSFPNFEKYWGGKPKPTAGGECEETCGLPTWKNYYATLWRDSKESALYALSNWERLLRETLLFKRALFTSDLPPAALDAVSANLAVLKTPTVLRLEDGTFYGWEGCHPDAGCCEGSCTHVWNYAQALPFLFPKLERSMREVNYEENQRPDGGMAFRLQLPPGSGRSKMRPCADGQFGDVMKTYRDWKICGDTEWLRGLWPAVKRSMEFAWSEANPDRWDPERTGVLRGRQHHTLDMELFGPNSWLTGFYLGALTAAAEMADEMGEPAVAEDYRSLFEAGRTWVEENLFNGEYYQQRIDLDERSLLEGFDREGDAASTTYWSDEHGEIKYQIGEGCGIDQVLAEWHADLYGLGAVFDRARARRALEAVFRHNFKDPMRHFPNPCRVFCLNDEAGLVICDWPEGKRRPAIPLTYSQETMHGYEYAAACLMIRLGLVKEGMTVVEAVRDRYDGERRNPWNEIECGSNYARSMASYALLNAFSGFRFDMTRGLVGFDPVATKESGGNAAQEGPRSGGLRCFWSLETGWGMFATTWAKSGGGSTELEVLYGHLEVRTLALPFLEHREVGEVTLGGSPVEFAAAGGEITLGKPARVGPGRKLAVAHRD